MATTTRVKQWGFGTASNYTLEGDATIAAGVLSMTDPALPLPFDDGGWDSEPPYNNDGDALPSQMTYYTAQADGADLDVADGMLVVQAKRNFRTGSYAYLVARSEATKEDGIYMRLTADNCFFYDAVRTWVSSLLVYEIENDEWIALGFRFCGTSAGTLCAGKRLDADPVLAKTDSGAVKLYCIGTTSHFTIGNGGAAAAPVFYYRRTGLCAVKNAHALIIPYGVTALGRLTVSADRCGGGTEPLDLPLQYRLDGTDPWVDVPDDGDLSGVSFTPGKSMFNWRFWHTGSVGMDNANDCRYVPKVYAVFLTYEQTTPDWNEGGQLKDVLTNIKAALNADATLQGYEGWSGAQVGWVEVMNLKLYHRCGCLVEWKETPERPVAAQRSAGALVNAIDETHTVTVKACMRLDRDLEEMLIGDDQLLDFTESVLSVLRAETLSGTVHSATVTRREPTTDYFESGEGEDEPGDILLVVDIEVEVHGKPFEAVRP